MTLRRAIATPAGKRQYVGRLFATIADRYDLITGLLSYGQDRRWKRRLIGLAALAPSDRVLDLACGTGDLLFEAAPHVSRAIGLDLTHRMLQLARQRATELPPSRARRASASLARTVRVRGPSASTALSGRTRPDLGGGGKLGATTIGSSAASMPELVTGDMLALPFARGQFDVVTTGYGLRNVPDLDDALREIHRVLTPGGRLLSLDFNRPRNPLVRAVYLTYLSIVGSALGFVLHRDPDTYRYIPESIRTYPGADGVARMMEAKGFVDVRVVPVLGGLMAIHVARKG